MPHIDIDIVLSYNSSISNECNQIKLDTRQVWAKIIGSELMKDGRWRKCFCVFGL